MPVNPDALKDKEPQAKPVIKNVEVLKQETSESKTCYIFYSVLQRTEDGKFIKNLLREDVSYTSPQEAAEKVARSTFAIFSQHAIEWTCVSPTPYLPDLKNLYLQNKIHNLEQMLKTEPVPAVGVFGSPEEPASEVVKEEE